ncbi:hypothetical protein GDO81_011643 [Engystomops pustulosus]|uniref:Uncharacterized protein n=1 Tax=Engystomops pustulosus TaxID=76066 RepID=A0AAV7BFY2_ENGPU|nr:hypothetical protein GDO81_011643 [Engystomops pustulosus]
MYSFPALLPPCNTQYYTVLPCISVTQQPLRPLNIQDLLIYCLLPSRPFIQHLPIHCALQFRHLYTVLPLYIVFPVPSHSTSI